MSNKDNLDTVINIKNINKLINYNQFHKVIRKRMNCPDVDTINVFCIEVDYED